MDVNADNAVDANDALILYYSYSLGSTLGTGRGDGGAETGGEAEEAGGTPGAVSIRSGRSFIAEGEPLEFVLNLGCESLGTLTVNVAVSGDTVASDAFGVGDVVEPVVFEEGDATATLRVSVTDDELKEDNKLGTVSVTVQPGAGYAVAAGDGDSPSGAASVKVADDDFGWFKECGSCPEMVVVPAGSFMMGSPDDETGRRDEEGPQHLVTFDKPFAVSRHEVTFRQWNACRSGGGGCANIRLNPNEYGHDNHPVSNVRWDQTDEFTRWVEGQAGAAQGTYRLLTEAEWEYAARASSTTAYHWGDTVDTSTPNARCNGCESSYTSFPRHVGNYPANAWGLYDMAGNVWEWVEDRWHGNYNGAPTDGSAWSGTAAQRVLRGGSWIDTAGAGPDRRDFDADDVRSAVRWSRNANSKNLFTGFRVARSLD